MDSQIPKTTGPQPFNPEQSRIAATKLAEKYAAQTLKNQAEATATPINTTAPSSYAPVRNTHQPQPAFSPLGGTSNTRSVTELSQAYRNASRPVVGFSKTNLYVAGFPKEWSENDLRGAFGPFGDIRSVNVWTNRETGEGRGCGFVDFENAMCAQQAITNMNGSSFPGSQRPLLVKAADVRTGNTSRGYRNNSGGGNRHSSYSNPNPYGQSGGRGGYPNVNAYGYPVSNMPPQQQGYMPPNMNPYHQVNQYPNPYMQMPPSNSYVGPPTSSQQNALYPVPQHNPYAQPMVQQPGMVQQPPPPAPSTPHNPYAAQNPYQ